MTPNDTLWRLTLVLVLASLHFRQAAIHLQRAQEILGRTM